MQLDRNLLQKEVAILLGVSETTLLDWEKNYHQPEVRHYPRIMDFLGYCPCEPKRRTLGERLKMIRIFLLGISLAEMAKRLRVDEGTLGKWEKGGIIRHRRAQNAVIDFLDCLAQCP